MLALVLSFMVLVGSSLASVKAETATVTFTVKGWGSLSGTSYVTSETEGAILIDDSISISAKMNYFIPSSGQIRGNQTSVDGNFYIYNVDAIPGSITKIELTATTDANNYFKNKVYAIIGDSSQSSVNDVSVAQAGVIDGSITWSFTASDEGKYFKVYSNEKFTNGSLKDASIIVTYELPLDGGKVKVRYNANGGTGSMDDDIIDENVDTTLSSNIFVAPTGYKFNGWNTKSDGTGDSYFDQGTINVGEDTTLYAQWTFDSDNYTKVVFHANNDVLPEETKELGVKKNTATALSSNTFTNGGMGFVKWNTLANGEGTDYLETQEVTISSQLDLYAQWGNYSIAEVLAEKTVDKLYTITGEITALETSYNAVIQDSTGAILLNDQSAISANQLIVGNTVTLTGKYNSSVKLTNLENIQVLSNDTIVNTTPITDASNIVETNQYHYVEMINLKVGMYSSNAYNVVGEDFKLYYNSSETEYCNGYENITDGKYVDIKGVISFYNNAAQVWVVNAVLSTQYTLTFVSNGGSSVAPSIVLNNEKYAQPTNPTKVNDINGSYTFDGWYLDDETFQEPFDFNCVYNENKTVYAKWILTPIASYTIFEGLTTKANMNFGYNYSCAVNIKSNFICTSSSSKDAPSGWTLDVKSGSYANPYWQSFRNNGEYALTDTFTTTETKFNLSITCYLNNTGSTGSKSSTITFQGLDSNSNVVSSWTSEEINTWETGISNSKTLTGVLNGEGIVKIKVLFNKNGGGNVAFSKISINTPISYELTKNNDSKNNLVMQFAGQISAELKAKLEGEGSSVTYGMIYCKSSKLGETEYISDVAEWLNSKEFDIEDLAELGIKVKECTPVGTDESGFVSGDAYYQWGIQLSNISNENIATLMKVAAYVCIDGTYYIMNERELSVKTLAATYLDESMDKSSYEEHLGALEWLASYTA